MGKRIGYQTKDNQKGYFRQWRKYNRLSLQKLSDRIAEIGGKISIPTLSRIERGHQEYSSAEIKVISDALGIDPQELLFINPEQDFSLDVMIRQLDPDRQMAAKQMVRALIETMKNTP